MSRFDCTAEKIALRSLDSIPFIRATILLARSQRTRKKRSWSAAKITGSREPATARFFPFHAAYFAQHPPSDYDDLWRLS
jgi:hypothetical protein